MPVVACMKRWALLAPGVG